MTLVRIPLKAVFALLVASGGLLTLAACGGGSSQQRSPPTSPDFALAVSPISASGVVGQTSSPVTISVSPKQGFNAVVNVTLAGLPSGVTTTPSSPFMVQPGMKQPVTFSSHSTAPTGVSTVTVSATSGSLSHTAQVLLTTEPIVSVQTYQSGSLLYLESDTPTDACRIGLQTIWGGSIVEVSLNGNNFVNEHDTGREVQVAQYDGSATYDDCAGCSGKWGWNPVQGGDKYDAGSPVVAQILNADSLYIKTQPFQWNPDDKGGGPGQPVVGDVYVEATVSAVVDHAFTFKAHYKITHFGSDLHTDSIQEFPAVYVNLGYDRFGSDSSTTPWTNAPVAFVTMPALPQFSPNLYASEQWGTYVDTNNQGLTVFVPGMAPYNGGFAAPGDPGPNGDGTNYFAPRTFFTFTPNSVLEGDVYLIAGDYIHARQVIYDLHNKLPAKDIFDPIGTVDTPAPNTQLSGTASVAGWALDDSAVSRVDVYVDGVLAGTATYGGSRPDVANDWPHAPAGVGFTFSLNTGAYANGAHVIEVRAVDTSNNVAILPDIPVTIQN